MLTEPELIQRQRVLLRQVRTANQVRVNIEATITDLHQVCLNAQQEAKQTLQDVGVAKLLLNVTPETPRKSETAFVLVKSAAERTMSAQQRISMLAQAFVVARAEAAQRRMLVSAVVIVGVVMLLLMGWGQYTNWQREQAVLVVQATAIAHEAQAQATATAQEVQAQATATAQVTMAWRNPMDDALYIYVPAGAFRMGSDVSGNDEKPVHTVTLGEYWIGQTEVTTAQYSRCVASGTCTLPDNSRWQESDRANHPVTDVDWFQATAYCTWAGARLPTEAEWEKAERGSSTSLDGAHIYPWGDYAPNAALLNYDRNVGDTTPVGSYPAGASPYGALDMAGNVWEWVNDWYSENYYSDSPADNPLGPEKGESRVLRGGAWDGSFHNVRSTDRYSYLPIYGDINIGFRCVRSP